jgi:hypothetical protein
MNSTSGWWAPAGVNQGMLKFKIYDQFKVDNATWYTIDCCVEINKWIREQSQDLWNQGVDDIKNPSPTVPFTYRPHFHVHEKLYTMLILRWS